MNRQENQDWSPVWSLIKTLCKDLQSYNFHLGFKLS